MVTPNKLIDDLVRRGEEAAERRAPRGGACGQTLGGLLELPCLRRPDAPHEDGTVLS
jgi:hypothetical protein